MAVSLLVPLLGILAAAGVAFFNAAPRLPAHLLGHPVRSFPALLSASTRAELLNLTRALGELPGVASAERGYAMTHEHIGEGLEHAALPGGRCAHAFLVPSADARACVLPGRIDVARHFVSTGGHEALREQPAALLSRAQSFIRYIFDPRAHAVTARLFADAGFLAAARAVCPAHAQVLDPFQTTLIAQVPGQAVPAHVDGVFFRGASRFHVPQWLLAVMAFSGLFRERLVPQVQLVAYFHEWADARGARGGALTHWASGAPAALAAEPGSGYAMDGSRTVHAAGVFEPRAAPPALDKDVRHALVFDNATAPARWRLESGGQRTAHAWTEAQLRLSVVYRARCFASEAEREGYAAELAAREGLMDLETDILEPLVREAARRGAARSLDALRALPRLDLAFKLLDAFVRYPLPAAPALPFNYCALPKLFPNSGALQRAIDWLCPMRQVNDGGNDALAASAAP
jgi:hypothetical protein